MALSFSTAGKAHSCSWETTNVLGTHRLGRMGYDTSDDNFYKAVLWPLACVVVHPFEASSLYAQCPNPRCQLTLDLHADCKDGILHLVQFSLSPVGSYSAPFYELCH